jgi:uncharacterized membrane protein
MSSYKFQIITFILPCLLLLLLVVAVVAVVVVVVVVVVFSQCNLIIVRSPKNNLKQSHTFQRHITR